MLSPQQITEGTFLLFDKPKFWTSHDVVYKVRSVLSHYTKERKLKVGHAGTLDPLATGLLILATGKFTKRIDEIQTTDKEYTGTFYLGATTASYDAETPLENINHVNNITPQTIQNAAMQFMGETDQMPPVHSAIKQNGESIYHRARAGEEIQLAARKIIIHRFDITDITLPLVSFRIQCGKGTYIRSIAHDLGQALGCGAYLYSLCRTAIGDHRLENALQVEDFLLTYKDLQN